MKLKSFLIFIVLSVVSGCTTDGCIVEGCFAGQQYSGEMLVTKKCSGRDWSSSCEYIYTLTNSPTSPNYIEPRLDVFVTDCDGNTLDERRIFFDTILRGKKQTKKVYHEKSEDERGSVINVLRADAGWESYGESKLLQGVHGLEYKWGCN